MKNSIPIIVLFFLLAGCSNYKELNQSAIVLAMGIDYNEDTKQYEVTFQVVNPRGVPTSSAVGGSETLSVVNLSGSGKTITEAAGNTALKFERKSLYYHTALIVMGESAAKKGISTILDVVERDPEIRPNITILLARDIKASLLLEIIPPFDKIPTKALLGKQDNAFAKYGGSNSATVYQVISAISSKGKEPVISAVSISGNRKKGASKGNLESIEATYAYMNGMGVFHDGKLVGWLDGEKIKTIQLLANKLQKSIITVPCGKGKHISMYVYHSNSKNEVKMNQDIPDIKIKVYLSGYMNETLCKKDVTEQSVVEDIQKHAEKVVKAYIEASIKEAKKYKSDIFGFGENLYRSNPKVWKQVKGDWNELFSKANVDVNVEVEIEATGLRKKHY